MTRRQQRQAIARQGHRVSERKNHQWLTWNVWTRQSKLKRVSRKKAIPLAQDRTFVFHSEPARAVCNLKIDKAQDRVESDSFRFTSGSADPLGLDENERRTAVFPPEVK